MAVSILKTLRTATVISQLSVRTIVTGSVMEARGRVKWGHLNKECEERTKLVLTDRRKLKSIYTPPKFAKNISELFKFFPLSPDKVENILMDYPEVLAEDS